MTEQEIAKAALGIEWRDTESQARRVAEYAAEYMMPAQWIACADRLPADETEVLILRDGVVGVGELRWDKPGYEDNYEAYRYWDDPNNDGQAWEWNDITHWMPLPGSREKCKLRFVFAKHPDEIVEKMPSYLTNRTDEFNEGYLVGYQYTVEDMPECPHEPGTQQHMDWWVGWNAGQEAWD